MVRAKSRRLRVNRLAPRSSSTISKELACFANVFKPIFRACPPQGGTRARRRQIIVNQHYETFADHTNKESFCLFRNVSPPKPTKMWSVLQTHFVTMHQGPCTAFCSINWGTKRWKTSSSDHRQHTQTPRLQFLRV